MTVDKRSLGTLAAVVLLVVLAGCAGGTGGNDAGANGGPADTGDAASKQPGSFYADGDRIVIREASMRMEVRRFDSAFKRARTIAEEHGGFVADWDHDIERGWHSGELTIRVPADNFTAVRDELAGLGTLEREDVQAKDFSDEYSNAANRVADLRERERELEQLLEETDDPAQSREIVDDLHTVRQQIQRLQNQRTSIERREALSTIHLTIHEPIGKRPPKNYRTAFGFDDAFLDAFYGGLVVVKYAIVFVGYVIPIGFAAVLVGSIALVWLRVWQLSRARLDLLLPDVTGRSSSGDAERADADDGEE